MKNNENIKMKIIIIIMKIMNENNVKIINNNKIKM